MVCEANGLRDLTYIAANKLEWASDLPIPPLDICNNVSINRQRDVPRIKPVGVVSEPFVFAGGGPSLDLDAVFSHSGKVFTSGLTLKHMVDHGYKPWAHMTIDPKPHMVGYLDPKPVDIRYFVSSAADPAVFEALDGFNVWMLHTPSNVGEDFDGEPLHTQINGGTTTPLRALTLGYALGFREFHFHGCDSSLADGHYAYPKQTDGGTFEVETSDGRTFATTGLLAHQAHQFDHQVAGMQRFDPTVSVTFHGDGLLPHMMRLPPLKETEDGHSSR